MPNPKMMVDQGLSNSQDPSNTMPGELLRANDCFYKPSDPALWEALGRVVFNSSALDAPVIGARALQFADLSSIFVAYDGDDYHWAPAGLTGSFTPFGLGLTGGGTSLDSAYSVRGDLHILFNGVDRNRTIAKGAIAGFHGMLQNLQPPVITQEGAGTFTLTTGHQVQYWIEERVKDVNGNVLRRNISVETQPIFGQSPATYPYRAVPRGTSIVQGGGVTVHPRIYRPPIVNPDATHWALFGTSATSVFPNGGELGEAAIGVAFIDDTRSGTDPGLSGTLYETIAVSLRNLTVTSTKHGPPPIATTGDFFEGALLLNDVANPLYVRYSFWDEPHAFPPLFTIVVPAKKNDVVTGIAKLDNFAMILCRESIWRLNTLPLQDDSAFSVSRILTEVEGAHGCVGPKAFAKFSFGSNTRLAYVSPSGIVITDGQQWSVLTSDFDWEDSVEISQLSKAVLINHPRFYLLELRYPEKGATRNTKKLFIHYHPSHAKVPSGTSGYRAKITGPINQDANDAFGLIINGVQELFDANQDGRLYRCHTGSIEPTAPGGMKMDVLTPDRYPGQVGMETTLRTLFVHHQASPGEKATITVMQRHANRPDDPSVDTIPLDLREATPTYLAGTGEAFQFGFTHTATGGPQVALDYFVPFIEMPQQVEAG